MQKHGLSVRSVYTVLESILQYHANLQGFLADLEGRTFLQSSLEGVLLGLEGKQLMVEAVAGLSAILLVRGNRLCARRFALLCPVVSHRNSVDAQMTWCLAQY